MVKERIKRNELRHKSKDKYVLVEQPYESSTLSKTLKREMDTLAHKSRQQSLDATYKQVRQSVNSVASTDCSKKHRLSQGAHHRRSNTNDPAIASFLNKLGVTESSVLMMNPLDSIMAETEERKGHRPQSVLCGDGTRRQSTIVR